MIALSDDGIVRTLAAKKIHQCAKVAGVLTAPLGRIRHSGDGGRSTFASLMREQHRVDGGQKDTYCGDQCFYTVLASTLTATPTRTTTR